MEPIYIIAIVVGALIFILFCVSIYVIAKGYRREEKARNVQKAVYTDPKLAKMEYDIAFYDEETAAKLASAEDKAASHVATDEVSENNEASVSAERTAEEEAIFNKPEEGMEEIEGFYEPKKGEEE